MLGFSTADLENAAIVAVLIALWVFLGWADRRDLFASALFRLRIKSRKQLPVGRYRWSEPNSIRVGRPDSVVVFRMPLQEPGVTEPATCVAVSDASTRFGVGDAVVAVDPFLEAYDAELGPLEVEVIEPGRIAAIKVDTEAASRGTHTVD